MRFEKACLPFLGLFFTFGSLSVKAADSYKRWNLSLPIISFGGEGVGKFEMNLSGHGALGLEVAMQQESEFFTQKEVEEKNNDSLMMKGTEVAVIYSSYSNSKLLSGGFWSFGFGYRRMRAIWEQTPENLQNASGIALTADGKLVHELGSFGPTLRARFGYRYVAESVPFSAGAYLGVSHFQNKFADVNGPEIAVITADDDLRVLERRMMSRLEPGIELGFSF